MSKGLSNMVSPTKQIVLNIIDFTTSKTIINLSPSGRRCDFVKLNPDCIRDILLAVEDKSSYGKLIFSDELFKSTFLSSYSEKEVLYHTRQLAWSKLLEQTDFYLDNSFSVLDLSPQGHEFLNNIRSNDNWNKTKEFSNKAGSLAISTLQSVASSIISASIQKYLGF